MSNDNVEHDRLQQELRQALSQADLLRQQLEEARLHAERCERELASVREGIQFSEHRLHAMLDTLPQGIFLKDRDSNYILCNRAHAELLGLESPEAIAGKRDDAFFSPELARKYQQDDRWVIDSGETIDMEESTTMNGRPLTVQTVKAPMRDERGDTIGVLGIYWDISVRKQIEEQLRFNEALLSDAGEMARIGGWQFDVNTGEGIWTDEVARIHDMDSGDPTSRDIGLGVYQGESRARIERAIHDAIEFGRSYDLELEMVTARGRKKWVRTIGHPVVRDGRTILIRGAFQDITEQKQAEATMQQRLDELERFRKATVKREFRIRELKDQLERLKRESGGQP